MYYSDPLVTLYNKDCRVMGELLDNSIQCVITSPPYWGLRKYAGLPDLIWGGDDNCEHKWVGSFQPSTKMGREGLTDGKLSYLGDHNKKPPASSFCSLCGAWKGQLGLEPSPEMYIPHLIEIFREVRRVLRSDGVAFVNIGDSYVSGKSRYSSKSQTISGKERGDNFQGKPDQYYHPVLKDKDLCLIPFRLAIALQEDGWWVRSVIIWSKPNPMPESVTDRPTESHEYILMLTKSAHYYYDQEAVREPITYPNRAFSINHLADRKDRDNQDSYSISSQAQDAYYAKLRQKLQNGEPTGRNLRSVWTFSTQPYPEAHFATYPEKLVEICVKAASRRGDIVLDPFCGSGTTLAIAKRLGRQGVGYELSANYCELAVKRIEAETAPLL